MLETYFAQMRASQTELDPGAAAVCKSPPLMFQSHMHYSTNCAPLQSNSKQQILADKTYRFGRSKSLTIIHEK